MISKRDHYQPQVVTLEEFQTLTALTYCLLPHEPGELPLSLAALFDQALHQAKREPWRLSELPPDAQAIRSGLQLLNYDSLRFKGRAFADLTLHQQEELLVKLQRDGDLHWPQFGAGKWFEEVVAITTELYLSSPESYVGARAVKRG